MPKETCAGQRLITDFMDAEMDSNIVVNDDGGVGEEQSPADVFENGDANGVASNDLNVEEGGDLSAGKRQRVESPTGLSPVCKRSFSLDGKEISFENEPWYVGWLFAALDQMRAEFQFTADMITSVETFKSETNSRIALLEAEREAEKEEVKSLKAELSEQKEALKAANDEIRVLGEAMKCFRAYTDDHIDQIAKQLVDYRGVFKSHWEVIDEQEQYSSRECIVMHGIPEGKKDENTDQLFVKEINTRLNENISVSDLDRTHRLGKPGGGRKGPRPIIAKLIRYNDKARIFGKKRLLRGTRIMLTERLTQRRSVFFRYAREKFGGFNCWTRDGDIYVKSENEIKNMTNEYYKVENEIRKYYQNGGPDPM